MRLLQNKILRLSLHSLTKKGMPTG